MRRVLLLVILAAFIGDRPALAGTLVEFPNLPGREPARLIGYLARPDAGLSALIRTTPTGAAPYPAVVALHGCGGISSHSAAIADRLGAWGYVRYYGAKSCKESISGDACRISDQASNTS